MLALGSWEDMACLDLVLALARDLRARELTAVGHGGIPTPTRATPSGGLMAIQEDALQDAFLGMQADLVARAGDMRVEWRSDVTLDPTGFLIAQLDRSDLLIVLRKRATGGVDLDLGRLVISAGRPVLILPASPRQARLRKVAIAYRDTRESRLALLAALPFLKQADEIVIMGAGETAPVRLLDEAAAFLSSHHLACEIRSLGEDCSTGDGLVEAAQGYGADLLVCGAFGRSRAAEWLLGGVTRSLVADCPLPCLMIH